MIRETTEADIRHVCAHMRAVDAEEHFATRFPGDDNPDALARDLVAAMPRAIMSFCFVGPDGLPAALLSAYQASPGVARLHRISTDAWAAVSREAFQFGIERFMPALAQVVHRAECSVLVQHGKAQKILLGLGLTHQGIARARGRDGEDFVDFAWVKR